MYVRLSLMSFVHLAIAVACMGAAGAWAAESAFPEAPGARSGQSSQAEQPARTMSPSASNELYRKLKTQCETDVACGKASADVCVEAAGLLVGNDLPDEFRESKEDQRIKIALRLLERGVDSSNVARGRAYDWYNRVGFLGLSAYADPYRAAELMEMMTKSSYPGGYLRKARSSVSILSLTTSDAEKKEYCAGARKLIAAGKLDEDSVKIAKEVLTATSCTDAPQQQ